jgi:hypothetical protein
MLVAGALGITYETATATTPKPEDHGPATPPPTTPGDAASQAQANTDRSIDGACQSAGPVPRCRASTRKTRTSATIGSGQGIHS